MIIICAKLFINLTMHNKVTGQTCTVFTEAYAQCLRADCDLDLGPSNTILVCDISSCHDIICAKLFSIPNMHDNVMGCT